ncbi:hypothetical protein G6F56_009472 [Rhizopus delemar]|uniref:Uncharacterized protein n=1 Tax=Rhizopus stolonifer TaxID=4846 RepID=A0A367INL4_RHIST|nr:hypothetical protein G6F56_009472 [Rhizopus delemar]RCH79265.1 hypothetical protein CU098_001654 [Rhizopus stolonifer]
MGAHERNTERSKFVIKTNLETMLRPVLNQDQRDTFINIRRIVRHVSDVTLEVRLSHSQKWKPLSSSDRHDERTPIFVAFGVARFGDVRGNVAAPSKLFRAALLNCIKRPKLALQRNDIHGPKIRIATNQLDPN